MTSFLKYAALQFLPMITGFDNLPPAESEASLHAHSKQFRGSGVSLKLKCFSGSPIGKVEFRFMPTSSNPGAVVFALRMKCGSVGYLATKNLNGL